MIINRPACEYYAFAGLPLKAFETISAIYALYEKITHIPYEVSEPTIAHQKCMFYQNDMGKMIKHEATHPQCIALQNDARVNALVDWQPIITAAQMDIDRITFYNDSDFERYAHKKYGALYQLIGKACRGELTPQAYPPSPHQQLGYFIAQVVRLQRIRQDNFEQQHIPRSVLSEHHIDAWQLEQQDEKLMPLINALITQALDHAALPQGLPKPLQILHRLYRDILLKMQAQPEALLTHTVDTLPIKKLWVSRFQRILP